MKKQMLFLIMFLIFTTNILKAEEKTLSSNQLRNILINKLYDKTKNKNKYIYLKNTEDIDCFGEEKYRTCSLNDIELINTKFKKSFYKLKMNKVILKFKEPKEKNYKKESMKKWIKYKEELEKKEEYKKNIKLINSKEWIYRKNIESNLNLKNLIKKSLEEAILSQPTIKIKENGFYKQIANKIIYKIKDNKIIFNEIDTNFLINYVNKTISKEYKKFKITTKLKGIKKAIEDNKYKNYKKDIIKILKTINKKTKIEIDIENKICIIENENMKLKIDFSNNSLKIKEKKLKDFYKKNIKKEFRSLKKFKDLMTELISNVKEDINTIYKERIK